MDDFSKMIKEMNKELVEMNKDIAERRKIFDSIQPLYIGLILIGFGSEFSDDVFLKAAGIESI